MKVPSNRDFFLKQIAWAFSVIHVPAFRFNTFVKVWNFDKGIFSTIRAKDRNVIPFVTSSKQLQNCQFYTIGTISD